MKNKKGDFLSVNCENIIYTNKLNAIKAIHIIPALSCNIDHGNKSLFFYIEQM